jgi:hypothetical protein
MNATQLTLKVLELMETYKYRLEIHRSNIGYHYTYGPLYLEVLGNVMGDTVPSWIDVSWQGNKIGRINNWVDEKEFLISVCERLAKNHLESEAASKDRLEQAFLAAK